MGELFSNYLEICDELSTNHVSSFDTYVNVYNNVLWHYVVKRLVIDIIIFHQQDIEVA